MSAINGIVHFNEETIPIEQTIEIMNVLAEFPADDVGLWYNKKVFFGCHAQWITPESVGENLPYYDPTCQLVITADAIIDNRLELFTRLNVDHSKRSNMTDSKLILLAYQKWGEDTPKYLIGDYAFMIWDERNNKLFGARDFAGARTLYFHRSNKKFTFCTTIKPLFSLPYLVKKINLNWLADFLAIPSMLDSIDIGSTVFKDIQQLPPSHCITVTEDNIKLVRYCNLPDGEKLFLKSNEDYEEAFRDVYTKAITTSMRTHRNVGALLSGGLDSGSIVGFAAPELRKNKKKLHTFSYVPIDSFTDWTPQRNVADEGPFIRSTVEHVGNINDGYYSFEDSNPFSVIDEMLETMEMPYKFHVNSFWVNDIYKEAQKQDCGVLLNGRKGNWTVSYGSAIDFQATLLKKLQLIRFFQEFNSYSNNIGSKKTRILRLVRDRVYLNQKKPVVVYTSDLINDDFAKSNKVLERMHEQGLNFASQSWEELRTKQFSYLYHSNISGTCATKQSLRHSVWDRDPTNDLNVVKFCLSLPDDQYVQNGVNRSLIRRATKNYLPDTVRLNLRKRGIQGADVIQRMVRSWREFIQELHKMAIDPAVAELMNVSIIKSAIQRLEEDPRAGMVYEEEFTIAMRSLIVYRFIKNFL
ncbi:asparagine synthase-related protein [Bacillaceae bacterium IKA-2]|nr:asparagine synthase-related protein [Bacillaceae bacterium IKA-2]